MIAKIWCVVVLLLLTQTATAFELRDDLPAQPIWRDAEFFEDTSRSLTFSQIQHQSFKSNGAKLPNFGFTNSAMWMRVSVRNMSPETHFILFLDHIYISTLEFYIVRNGKTEHRQTGLSVPYRSSEIHYYGYAQPLTIQPGEEIMVYVRAVSKFPISLPLHISEKDVFFEKVRSFDQIIWCYIGLIAVLIGYNLMVLLSTRDMTYAFYLLSMLALHLFTNLTQYGVTRLYFFSQWSWFHSNVFYFAHLCSVSATLFFVKRFFLNREDYPFLRPLLSGLAFLQLPLMIAGFVLQESRVDMLCQLITTLFAILLASAAIKGTLQGRRPARYFCAAWSCLIIAWILNFLRIDGVLPSTTLLSFIVLVGAGIEGVLISLALADRLNQAQKMKEEAERRAIENLAKYNLAAQVSHDIRSPLSALRIAVSSLKTLPVEHQSVINGALLRISDIANGLLYSGVAVSQKAHNMSLEQIVRAMVREKETQYQDRPGLKFKTHIECDPTSIAVLAATEIERILSNLIDNSVEACTSGGEILICVREESFWFVIEITDDGCGIELEHLPLVTRPGFSYGKQGSGRGLSHAKESLERAGGSLKIYSIKGKGTTVKVQILKAKPATAESAEHPLL